MVDPHKLAKARKAAPAKKAAPRKATSTPAERGTARASARGPATTDDAALKHMVQLTSRGMSSTHHSTWSQYEVKLPSGRKTRITIPLKSAVEIEKAGYSIKLIGRLND